jgi:hypothetical protein
MASTTIDDIRQDPIAMSVAHALAIANETAKSNGADTSDCLITVSEDSPPPSRSWRIHYGPRNYISRRGGDLVVIVDEAKAAVARVLRGQ